MEDKPRSYPAARLLRATEPYHYQRARNTIHYSQPRPSQPNTNQPNARVKKGWGMSSREYWDSIGR